MGERGSGEILYVHPVGVIASTKDIDAVNTEIKDAFVRLKSEGEEVIGGSWTGSAADKLDEGWQQWQEGVHTVTLALDDALGLVVSAVNAFEAKSSDLKGL